MNVNPQAIATMRAITISREYGSGGGEIATRLARRLGWQLMDHAMILTDLELEVVSLATCFTRVLSEKKGLNVKNS
jgi:hypothetical protein